LMISALHLYGITVFYGSRERLAPEGERLCIERTSERMQSRSGPCFPRNGLNIQVFDGVVFVFWNSDPPGSFTITCRLNQEEAHREFGYYTQHLSRYRRIPVECPADRAGQEL
jgi:hypothetical protein